MSVMKQKLTIEVEYDSSRWTDPNNWFDTLNNRPLREIAGQRPVPTFIVTDYNEPSNIDLVPGKWYRHAISGYQEMLAVTKEKVVYFDSFSNSFSSPEIPESYRGKLVETSCPL